MYVQKTIILISIYFTDHFLSLTNTASQPEVILRCSEGKERNPSPFKQHSRNDRKSPVK